MFRARPEHEQNGRVIPAEELKKHLRHVATRAKDSLSSSTLPNSDALSEWAELCGLTHDFGKYTSYFQDKLPPKKQVPPKQAYGNHAFISALLGAFVAKQRYLEDPKPALLIYLAIHRHHGHLVTPDEVLPRAKYLRDAPAFEDISGAPPSFIKGEHLRAIQAQLENLKNSSHYAQIIQEMKSLGVPETEAFLEQDNWWQLLDELRTSYKEFTRNGGAVLYWQSTLLFSALIDADKHISAAASQGEDTKTLQRLLLPSRLVDDHIKTLKRPDEMSKMQQRLFDIRRDVYTEATQAIETRNLEELYPAVLSLTAPTGSGKTLTALGSAFRLRERVQNEHGTLPRIIYALPFVNIIDQNYDVTERVLSQQENFKTKKSNYLLKHHHLAPLAFKEDENRSNDDALLLTESWESEVIVTTFVQLLQSLITNRNRALKKLHNIAGSIIILDEVQSIPYEQWQLVEHVLRTLTEYLGCTVLQMTATRPHIFEKPQAEELLDQPEKHFEGLSRTKLIPEKDICDLEQLKDFVLEQKTPETSMLVVVNTIHSAVELYKKFTNEEENDGVNFAPYKEIGRTHFSGKCPIVHLSTNITPWQRKQRVRLLRRYMSRGGKPLVISTQVVEAGVDLDFDIVVRDQGPLDSIVQVAGRCNRNGTKGKSKAVYVVNLTRESGRSDAVLVYDKILPHISRRILDDVIEEPELYEKIDEYFRQIEVQKSNQESLNFIHAINKLHFHFADDSLSVSQYRLIEELEQAPVIVELSKDAREALSKLEQLYKRGGDTHAFREAYRDLGMYIVTPSKHRLRQKIPPRHPNPKLEEHFYLSYAEVHADYSSYYDLETGFKWQNETTIL